MKSNREIQQTVFTPLRIALIVAIILANVLALISQLLGDEPWAQALQVFAVVFIMLFVFVILLEMVWLHHRAKPLEDPDLVARYRLAKVIYGVLLLLGFAMAAWVLL